VSLLLRTERNIVTELDKEMEPIALVTEQIRMEGNIHDNNTMVGLVEEIGTQLLTVISLIWYKWSCCRGNQEHLAR
jgi:hypothetical protein